MPRSSKEREGLLDRAISLMALLGTMPSGRIAIARAAELLGCSEVEAVAAAEEIAVFGNRATGARAAVSVEGAYLRYRGVDEMIPQVRLTLPQSLALLSALNATSGPVRAQSLRESLAGILSPGEDRAASSDLVRDAAPWSPHLPALAEAVEVGIRCRIRYRSNRENKATWRTVDPHRLFESDDALYLSAWDVCKDAQRLYRLDRLSDCVLTEDSVARHRYDERTLNEAFMDDGTLVRVRFASREALAAADWQGILAVSGKRRGPVTVDVACTNLPWLFDQVLASDGAIELIGPADVLGTYAAYASSLVADPPQS